ncbi:hypothetical protein D6D01_08426 [Aureobasidium pullulans]|uniref:Uncharacterized protein n=1 Tax=Aureobasidium pullulans TaxID=5580 RepID=A0A4S9KE49_AURPU|nr:hypothetical protein D6D01_08426 [Aureobasidium pullulans]
METWVLIAENIEQSTMPVYRLVCRTLHRSAQKTFLTRFSTRRCLPTRKSLERLLHLLQNDDSGPSIERFILEPIPDNYSKKNRKSDFLFVHEELGFHQIFSAIKARGNKVTLEYVESETTCDYLRPHRGSLTYELHGQAFKADYEIPDISISAIGKYSLPVAGAEDVLWCLAKNKATIRATHYSNITTNPAAYYSDVCSNLTVNATAAATANLRYAVDYTPHDKALSFQNVGMVFENVRNLLNVHCGIRISSGEWITTDFTIHKLQLSQCTIRGPGVLERLLENNRASLQFIEIEDVHMELSDQRWPGQVGDGWHFWGDFLHMLSDMPALESVKVSKLRYLRQGQEQLDWKFDEVKLPGGAEEVDIKGNNFRTELEDLASFVMAADQRMRAEWLASDATEEPSTVEADLWKGKRTSTECFLSGSMAMSEVTLHLHKHDGTTTSIGDAGN